MVCTHPWGWVTDRHFLARYAQFASFTIPAFPTITDRGEGGGWVHHYGKYKQEELTYVPGCSTQLTTICLPRISWAQRLRPKNLTRLRPSIVSALPAKQHNLTPSLLSTTGPNPTDHKPEQEKCMLLNAQIIYPHVDSKKQLQQLLRLLHNSALLLLSLLLSSSNAQQQCNNVLRTS